MEAGTGKERTKKSFRVEDSRERADGVRYLLQELLEVLGGDTTTAAQELAVVTAQLMLVPEAQVQPVARHVQVLGAEAGAAAEAPLGGSRHGEAAAPASVASPSVNVTAEGSAPGSKGPLTILNFGG